MFRIIEIMGKSNVYEETSFSFLYGYEMGF